MFGSSRSVIMPVSTKVCMLKLIQEFQILFKSNATSLFFTYPWFSIACFIFLLTDSSLIFVSIELIFSDYEMIVTVQGPRPKNILDLIHETIITLIKDSFQGVDYDFYIPCPDCVDKEVRDCCLTPHELFFSYMYIMTRTSYIWWDDNDVCFILDQHAKLDFYSANTLK